MIVDRPLHGWWILFKRVAEMVDSRLRGLGVDRGFRDWGLRRKQVQVWVRIGRNRWVLSREFGSSGSLLRRRSSAAMIGWLPD